MFFCKKLVVLGLGAAGAMALTNAVWSGSVSTAWKKARTAIERNVSPEFELERIRDQISRLTPDMNHNIEVIADATVEVGSLNRKIELVKVELEKRQGEILVLTEKVESGVKVVSYPSINLKDKLARDLKAYKSCEKDLTTKTKLLEAKRESLEAARRQLTTINESRQELEVLAAQYEAELANLRVAQCRSKFKLDDSRLSEIRGSFEKLRQRIDSEKIKAELAGHRGNQPGRGGGSPRLLRQEGQRQATKLKNQSNHRDTETKRNPKKTLRVFSVPRCLCG
jgi:chromosome segregation ATPase